ncbi:hypothetical protein [Streptomyces sp. NPDC051546]|uniref:hypothetical protein n=1 Tax=Streptomyces sp. NPDC051546 TaxID=3365655 RepID=UPI0037A70F2F
MSRHGRDAAGSTGPGTSGRSDASAPSGPAGSDTDGHAAERRRSDPAREEQVRPPRPQGGHRTGLLPDEGVMVDEHGRRPGAPSRKGTGSASPPSDPERVDRAAAEGEDPATPGRR